MESISKSQVVSLANQLRYKDGLTASDAFKLAWGIIKFKKRLRETVVDFSFIKTDGSIRKAKGTINLGSIPTEKHPKGNTNSCLSNIPYFDLGANGWRSFKATNLILN